MLVNQRLEAIARLATECGVALDEMHPGVPADSTHYQTVPIRVVGSGRYPACTAFLRKLRGTFGDMGIRSFQASSSGTTPGRAHRPVPGGAGLVHRTAPQVIPIRPARHCELSVIGRRATPPRFRHLPWPVGP